MGALIGILLGWWLSRQWCFARRRPHRRARDYRDDEYDAPLTDTGEVKLHACSSKDGFSSKPE